MKEIYPIVDIYQVSNISSDLFVQNVIIIAHKNVNSLSNQELIANSQNIISAINTEENEPSEDSQSLTKAAS